LMSSIGRNSKRSAMAVKSPAGPKTRRSRE
jgi:hypothetical protein